MVALRNQVTSKYNLGPVKPWVLSAAYLIGDKFNVKTIYGWRAKDPFPDHPSGHALDFMITSKSQGQAIADFLVANSSALGVKYVIWNRQVWESSGKPVAGWHAYTSTDNPHTDHVHVTFNDTAGTGAVSATSDAASASSSGGSTDPNCAWGANIPVKGNVCILSKVQVRAIVAVFFIVGAVGIGLVGIAAMTIQSFNPLNVVSRIGNA